MSAHGNQWPPRWRLIARRNRLNQHRDQRRRTLIKRAAFYGATPETIPQMTDAELRRIPWVGEWGISELRKYAAERNAA